MLIIYMIFDHEKKLIFLDIQIYQLKNQLITKLANLIFLLFLFLNELPKSFQHHSHHLQ